MPEGSVSKIARAQGSEGCIIETRDEVHLSPSYHNQPYRLDDFSGKPHERKSKILKLGVVVQKRLFCPGHGSPWENEILQGVG